IPVGTFPTGVLNGDYFYIQINVFVNSSGGYRARSAASPLSVKVTAVNQAIQVTPTAPTSPAQELWIFRIGGTVEQFYSVFRITSSYTTPLTDNTSDQDSINNEVTA